MPVCQNCNREVPENAAFCPFCGQAVQTAAQYAPIEPQIEKVNMFTAWKKYAQFSGRARRSEFWLWTLFVVLVNFVLGFLSGIFSVISPEIELVLDGLSTIASLAFLIPGWAVFCRRMHDTGRSGWNWLWLLLPIIGIIIVLVFECQDSQPGPNKYGPNPKGC